MDLEYGCPFTGKRQEALAAFLAVQGLDYAQDIEFSVNLLEKGQLIATGSLAGDVLKCLAVDKLRQGEGLLAVVVTELRKEAFRRGLSNLLVFTRPANSLFFESLGFSLIASTKEACFLESRREGLQEYLRDLTAAGAALAKACKARDLSFSFRQKDLGKAPEDPWLQKEAKEADGQKAPGSREIGCIVANCNPFTLGHRYLAERAAALCDLLYLFILSEEKSLFSSSDRLALARAGTADLPNVLVWPTGPYQVSRATFPAYFLKDKSRIQSIGCRLDLTVFARRIAPVLGICRRFVGEEPLSAVTRAYNEEMKAFLPGCGIAVTELPRRQAEGRPISASRVRSLWQAGRLEELRPFVPKTTWEFLHQKAKEKNRLPDPAGSD